jgi:outer membrane immunogenic protein
MTRHLLAAAAIAVAMPAQAADLPVKAPPAVAVTVYSWTGCYIGGHVGGLWGRTRWDATSPNIPGVDEPNQTVSFSSFTGGGHLGCNVQHERIVLGVEGDVSWARVNRIGFVDVVNRDELYRTRIDWYGSARARLGLASDRIHIYGTGGVAFSQVRHSFENYVDASLTVLQARLDATRNVGVVAGGGVEYAFTSNWVGRAEGLYYAFGRQNVIPDFSDARTSWIVGRVGLSYKFGGPVVARY